MVNPKLVEAYKIFLRNGKWEDAYSAIRILYEQDKEEGYKYIKDYRESIQRVVGYEKYHRMSYLLTARDRFDDFMVYIEWGRALQEQYWLPRRKKLMVVADALQDLEDGKLDELFLSMPPRVGKTTLILFFMLWVILRDPEKSNLYTSYTDSVVGVFYKGLLEILNDPYTYAWQDVFPERKLVSTNAKDLLLNIDREKRYASFTGRSLYGTLNGACDCNGYEVADDLISGIEEAMNKDRLMSAWSKVENNFLPSAKEGAKHLWIGTRWSIIDPQGMRIELLQNEDKFKSVRWRQINVPALDENEESNFDYAYGVGFSTEAYQQRRASFEKNNDMPSWLAQYQGMPIERDGAVFRPEDLRFYNGVLPDCDPDRIFMAVDPAWGGGDFVAAPICYQFGEDIFVADVVYDDRDKTVTQPMIVEAVISNNVASVGVEATKMTAEYADGIDSALREKGYRVNVMKTTKHYTGNGKAQRIFDKAPDIRERMVFLEAGKRSKSYEKFMQNVYSFSMTGKNKHDDAPDSLAMAINMAFFGDNRVQILRRMF